MTAKNTIDKNNLVNPRDFGLIADRKFTEKVSFDEGSVKSRFSNAFDASQGTIWSLSIKGFDQFVQTLINYDQAKSDRVPWIPFELDQSVSTENCQYITMLVLTSTSTCLEIINVPFIVQLTWDYHLTKNVNRLMTHMDLYCVQYSTLKCTGGMKECQNVVCDWEDMLPDESEYSSINRKYLQCLPILENDMECCGEQFEMVDWPGVIRGFKSWFYRRHALEMYLENKYLNEEDDEDGWMKALNDVSRNDLEKFNVHSLYHSCQDGRFYLKWYYNHFGSEQWKRLGLYEVFSWSKMF